MKYHSSLEELKRALKSEGGDRRYSRLVRESLRQATSRRRDAHHKNSKMGERAQRYILITQYHSRAQSPIITRFNFPPENKKDILHILHNPPFYNPPVLTPTRRLTKERKKEKKQKPPRQNPISTQIHQEKARKKQLSQGTVYKYV
jgi:hypothetical protein